MSAIAWVIWFFVGAGLSLLHFVILARSVGRLAPSSAVASSAEASSVASETAAAEVSSAQTSPVVSKLPVAQLAMGFLGRYASLILGIVLALRTGAAAGVVFVAGYVVARWSVVLVFARTGARGPGPV